MKILLNVFFKSSLFNKLSKFFGKKLIKYSKYFFVETKLKKLPLNNHPLKINYKNEIKNLQNFQFSKSFIPFVSYSHLIDLLEIYSNYKKNILFFDYGAGNLHLYYLIKNKLKKFKYYYHDQKEYINLVKIIKNKNKLTNLIIAEKKTIKYLDFVYFGSVIQYLQNYKNEIKFFFKKTKYIIIAQSPFFTNYPKEKIIIKQLNLFPTINYLYFINLDLLVNFMKKNNYILVNKSINKIIKFINFKNIDKKYKNMNMYDLVFKYEKKK